MIVSLDQILTWTKVSLDNSLLGLMSPWTNVSVDNCPLDHFTSTDYLLGQLFLGQLSPWTTVPWTNVAIQTKRNKKLVNCNSL